MNQGFSGHKSWKPPASDNLRPLLSYTCWHLEVCSDSQEKSLVLAPQAIIGAQAPGVKVAKPLGTGQGHLCPCSESCPSAWQGEALAHWTKPGQRKQNKSLRKRILSANEENARGSSGSPSPDRAFDPCLPAVQSEGALCGVRLLLAVTSEGSWVLPTPLFTTGPSIQDSGAKTWRLLEEVGVTSTLTTAVTYADECGFGSFAATGASGMGFVTRQSDQVQVTSPGQDNSRSHWSRDRMMMKLQQWQSFVRPYCAESMTCTTSPNPSTPPGSLFYPHFTDKKTKAKRH